MHAGISRHFYTKRYELKVLYIQKEKAVSFLAIVVETIIMCFLASKL